MPLRHRIQQDPQTVQELLLASDQRFREGIELIASGHRAGGAYLLGYVAEMLLKHACFTFDGARPFDSVPPRLGPARQWARRFVPSVPHEGYHSIMFWALVVRGKRRQRGQPLPAPIEARLLQRAHRLHGLWSVEMRYRRDLLERREASIIYDDVVWFVDHHHLLGV